MLTKVTLENFFSFGKATTIELNPGVNLLIGINASGKSNFLKALKLLKVGVVEGQLARLILEEWGGWSEVVNFSGGKSESIAIEYQFYFPKIEYFSYRLELKDDLNSISEKLTVALKNQEKVTVLDSTNLYGTVSGCAGYIGTSANKIQSFNFYEYGIKQPYFKKYIEQYTSGVLNVDFANTVKNMHFYNYFDISLKSAIRSASPFGIDNYLFSTGDNLNTVIQKIKNNQSLSYERLEEQLKNVNPHFKEIGFNLFGSKSYLLLREHNLDKAISIEHISDGTLYFLLHLAIFYNRERGKIVAIDEPETGLHPDMIRSIANAIKHAATDGTQLFIATHSPLFVNHFEVEELIIFEKDQQNQTIVKTIEDLEDLDEERPTGQLWLAGYLGGKRW